MNSVNYSLDDYGASIVNNICIVTPTTGGFPIYYSLDYYGVDIIHNGITITPLLDVGYKTLDEMITIDFIYSEILYCKLNDVDEKTKFRSILVQSWRLIGLAIVMAHTTLKIVQENVSEKGYKWNKKLQISFRSECATRTMREILNICKIGGVNLDIAIRLKDGSLVRYNSK